MSIKNCLNSVFFSAKFHSREMSRDNVANARLAMTIQASVGISCLGLILSTICYSLCAKWDELHFRTKRAHRALLWMLFLTVCAFCFFLDELMMYTNDWSGNPFACNVLASPFIPGLFATGKQFLYMFLYERAYIVHESLKLSGRKLKIIRTIVWLAVVILIP